MDISSHGKIYFRSRSGTKGYKLKECAYTTNEISATYHRPILGRRHIDMEKMARMHKENLDRPPEECNQLKTLYDICMQFVIDNLQLVDSFIGLPSLIGEILFDHALSNNKFCIKPHGLDEVSRNVALFTAAYGSEVMHTLNLSRKWKFVACYLDQISLFLPFLTDIELSSCRIGDEHDVLFELGNLYHLEKLILDLNDLGDDGIKNLVQKRRRAGLGSQNLHWLSVSGNLRLTQKCLVYLHVIPQLRVLRICMDKVAISKCFLSSSCAQGMNHTKIFDSKPETPALGWGHRLFKQWLHEFDHEEEIRHKRKLKRKERINPGGSFYKRVPISNLIQSKNLSSNHKNQPSVVLCNCGIGSKAKNGKRKYEFSVTDDKSDTKKSKQDKFDISLLADSNCQDILNLYM